MLTLLSVSSSGDRRDSRLSLISVPARLLSMSTHRRMALDSLSASFGFGKLSV